MSFHGMPDACHRRIHRSMATTEWASRPRPLVESPATTPTRCHSARAAAGSGVGCVPPRSRIRCCPSSAASSRFRAVSGSGGVGDALAAGECMGAGSTRDAAISGYKGSSKGQLMCTGPASSAWAMASSVPPSSASDHWKEARTRRSCRRSCSKVWLSQRSAAPSGRSAVRLRRGNPIRWASARAGPWFRAAVPLVQQTATGRPRARTMPRAWWAAARSSRATMGGSPASRMACMSGAFRDPGLTPTPARPRSTSPVMSR